MNPGAAKNPKTHPKAPAADHEDDRAGTSDDAEGSNENPEGASAPEGKSKEKPGTKPDAKKADAEFATPAQREKRVDAVRALRRDGWTEEEIDDLPPARLLSIGAKRAELQAKTDARFETLKGSKPASENREPIAEARGRTNRTEEEDEASPGAADLDQLLDEIADPDHASKVKVKVTEAEQRAAKAEARLLAVNIRAAKSELSALFPKLEEQAEWQRVLARMDKLDPSRTNGGDPDAVLQLMRDAYYIVFGPEITGKAQARKKLTDTTNQHLDGQPDTGSSNSAPAKRLTPEEADRAAYEASMGRTRDESAVEYKRRTGQRT